MSGGRHWSIVALACIAAGALAWVCGPPDAPAIAAAQAGFLGAGTLVREVRLVEGGFVRAPHIDLVGDEIRIGPPDGSRRIAGVHAAGPVMTRRLWLGSDQQGRDVLSRFAAGAQRSLTVALIAALAALLLGSFVGLAAAPRGSAAAATLRWLIDAWLAFPRLLLLLTLGLALGGTTLGVGLAVALVTWIDFARAAEGTARVALQAETTVAAHAVGVTTLRLLATHVAGALVPLAIAVLPVLVGRAMLLEASLGFLGVAGGADHDSWGRLAADGRRFLPDAWIMVVAPGVALVALTVALQHAARRALTGSTGTGSTGV